MPTKFFGRKSRKANPAETPQVSKRNRSVVRPMFASTWRTVTLHPHARAHCLPVVVMTGNLSRADPRIRPAPANERAQGRLELVEELHPARRPCRRAYGSPRARDGAREGAGSSASAARSRGNRHDDRSMAGGSRTWSCAHPKREAAGLVERPVVAQVAVLIDFRSFVEEASIGESIKGSVGDVALVIP